MSKSTKYKIGFVLDDSLDRTYNGVQRYIITLGNWLSSEGHEIHYLVGDTKNESNVIHSLSKNIKVKFNKNVMTIPLPANKNKIRKILDSEKYDILHVQMPYSPMLAGRVINYSDKKTAIVGTFHIVAYGKIQKISSKILSKFQQSQIRNFDAVCSVSDAAKTYANKYFDIDSVVTPNMIDLNEYQESIIPKPNKIVYLGRLVQRKGCKQLLQAINMLPADVYKNLEVIIAGDGPLRSDLERYCHDKKINKVKFIGQIEESQKAKLLASAKLAIFPALGGESFGIVLIEAMASGSGAVLAGDNEGYMTVLGGIPESIVSPMDIPNFASIIERYLTNKNLVNEVHKKQQNLVKMYDVNIVGPKIIKMYQKALLHKRRVVT